MSSAVVEQQNELELESFLQENEGCPIRLSESFLRDKESYNTGKVWQTIKETLKKGGHEFKIFVDSSSNGFASITNLSSNNTVILHNLDNSLEFKIINQEA